MRPAGPAKPHKRAGIWYYIRRIPTAFADLDRRRLVRISTNIRVADDPKAVRASQVVKRLHAETEAYWRGLRDGQSGDVKLRYAAAQQRARQFGLRLSEASFLTRRHYRERGNLSLSLASVVGKERRFPRSRE